jgi:hypothetical protein
MSRKNENRSQSQNFKWVMLVFLITTFISCSNTNERKNWGFKGNVKSCFERLYEAKKKFGKWENGDIEYYGHNRITFDKKGLYQEIEYYDDDMDLTGKLVAIREKRKLLEEMYYDGDGKLQSKTIVNNNEFDFESFDSNGEKTSYGNTIRKNGKIIKIVQTMIKNGVEDDTYTTLFEYDKDENIISQKRTNKKGEIDFQMKFEYLEFDEKKNWVKRLMYQDDDKPENIAIREIEYY